MTAFRIFLLKVPGVMSRSGVVPKRESLELGTIDIQQVFGFLQQLILWFLIGFLNSGISSRRGPLFSESDIITFIQLLPVVI